MLKLKRLIPALLSVVFAFAICASACDNGNKGEQGKGQEEQISNDKSALISIKIDTYGVKKSFALGDEFTAAGLQVTANFKNVDTDEVSSDDVSDDVVVDSSNYDANKVGSYDIHVSYTHAGVTRTDSYVVKVNAAEPKFGGITVEYEEGFNNKQNMQYNVSAVTIPNDKLIVKKVDANGEVGETLSASDYNVDLYLGSVKQSSWSVGGGAYTLLVSLKSDPDVTNFVNYYVIDQLTSLVWNKTAAGTVTEIDQWSSDKQVKEMASTWKFTAYYLSGASKPVTVADAGVTYSCNVETSGSQPVSVVYTDYNALGVKEDEDTSVTVTVNEINADINTYTYSYDALKAEMGNPTGDKLQLTAEFFTGVNSFLKFVEEGSSASDQYRSNGNIEIKGGRLQVTFQGKGYIEIGFSSSGDTDSGLVLMDKDNNYMYGIVKSGEAYELIADDDLGNLAGLFVIHGTKSSVVKFSVEEAGTYTIFSWWSHSGGSRGCRLQSVNMVDVVKK